MKPEVLFVLGPTASGKTSLSLQIAKNKDAHIINADSVQVYAGLDIGSAKPTAEELKEVPHHLIGHIPMGQDYTSGKFRKDVLDILSKNFSNKYLIVGGSGFYIKCLTHGLYEIPPVPQEIHHQIKNMKASEVFEELCRLDPLSAETINRNDIYRLQRALEVCRAFQKPFSSFKDSFKVTHELPFQYNKLGLFLERDVLRERVRMRVNAMISDGLIDEFKKTIELGYSNWKALQSVGYKEVFGYLDGRFTLDEMKDEIVKNTMGLAKRQMTWFRKDKEIVWFDAINEREKALAWAESKFSSPN